MTAAHFYVLLVICSFTLVVVVVNFLSRRRDHARTVEKDEEMWGLLKIVKAWAESARAHSKDAAALVHGIQEAGGRPEDVKAAERHVIEEVRKIPAATADQTADRAARQDEKLDAIHLLTNSSYSAQLKMTAMYARRVASLTGRVEDVRAAEQAEKAYRDHEAEQKKQAEVKAAAERTARAGGAGCGNVVAALLVGAVLLGLAPTRAGAEDMRREGEANALEWWAAEQGGSR